VLFVLWLCCGVFDVGCCWLCGVCCVCFCFFFFRAEEGIWGREGFVEFSRVLFRFFMFMLIMDILLFLLYMGGCVWGWGVGGCEGVSAGGDVLERECGGVGGRGGGGVGGGSVTFSHRI